MGHTVWASLVNSANRYVTEDIVGRSPAFMGGEGGLGEAEVVNVTRQVRQMTLDYVIERVVAVEGTGCLTVTE